MPLTRYQVRNEYSLADLELYKAADKDDPEALLEGVAMAGLVGVLRQLGDLAQFAAEIFHDLHEEVMATAARGNALMARVRQLDVDLPSIEKAFLSQSNHSSFYYNLGVDWRHNMHMDQNLITQGDLPRFIMDSYEECRGPPQLFLLDKFDVAGAGACLKRYTDPSFFKEKSMSSSMPNTEIHRDKRSRRVKKKGSRWKNGETPDALLTSRVKLHQLLLEERVESGKSDPARLVKLKRRQLSAHYDSQSGKSYMASFIQNLSPKEKEVHEISISPSSLSDSGLTILDVQTVGNDEDSYEAERSKCSSLTEAIIGRIKDCGSESGGETNEIIPNLQIVVIEKDQSVDEESTTENSFHVPPSDDSLDVASETENYVDALATMESETETYSEYRARSDSLCCNKVKQSSFLANRSHLFDSQSTYNSSSLNSRPSLVKKEVSKHCEIQSHLAEERRSDLDGASVVSNSMGGFESEMVVMTFGLHSASEEVSQIKSDESLVLGTSCIKVDEIPSPGYEKRKLSCGSCCRDSHSIIWPSDPKSGTEKILLSEPHFEERSSDGAKLGKESLDTEEIVTHAGIVIAPDLAQNVTQPGTVTAFEFDSSELSVGSDALLHLSDGLDLAFQQGCNEIVIPYVLYDGHATDIFPSNIVDGDIGSPLSVVLSPEKQILTIELPEVEPSPRIVPSSNAEKCDMVSEVGDEDTTIGINENTISSVDFPRTGNFLDQIQPEKTYIIAPRSATVDDLSSTEIKDLKEASKRYEGRQGNGYNLSTVVCDATSLGILSEYPGEDRSSDGKMPPSIQMEDVCLEESVLSPSRNADCEQIEVIEEAFSVRNLGAISCSNGSCEHFDIKLLNDAPDPLRDPYIDILSTWGGISSPSLDKNEQNIDSPFNIPSFSLGEPSSETSQQQDDQYIKECPNDFPSLPGKQTIYPYSINDATSSSTFCEKDVLFPDEIPFLAPSQDEQTQGSLPLDGGPLLALQGHLSFRSDDPMPSCNKYLFEVETFPKLGLELQCDQTDMKDLSSKEEASPTTSDVKSEYRSSLCQSDTQYYFYHSGETCPEDLWNQEYAPKILQQPENEKLKHKESSKAGAISASSEVLPLISKDTVEEIPSVSSSTTGRKVEVGFSGSQVDCLLPENPFMPLTSHNAPGKISPEDMPFAVPLITLPNGSVPRPPSGPSSFAGESLLPNPTSSSLVWEVEGILVEGALIQVDQNLSHPLYHLAPETYSGIEAEDNFQDLEGEMLNQPEVMDRLLSGENELPQHGLLENTATYIGEPSNQSAPESFSNNEKAEYTFQDIEGERHIDANMTNNWQSMIEEPPHQGWRTSEGEIAWSLSLPFSGDLNKLSRPRNPLIDAVAAHDKSKLRKVAERIRLQISPVINERGSLLEQIRTKSFNLKPAAVTRPSFQGPKTNLKIAAILEKANAIRQATAGSDEDDDEDSWSDS